MTKHEIIEAIKALAAVIAGSNTGSKVRNAAEDKLMELFSQL